ncbi:MAG: hypothetical protein V7K77_19760 [Nostoc sp.]|uniref:hypothetical protein n=1 Tax=Nostoc sp. TaxID=1180 RepID=UPI002FF48050
MNTLPKVPSPSLSRSLCKWSQLTLGLGNYQRLEFFCKLIGDWGLGTGMGEQSTMPHAPAKQSSTKISNNSVVQALHLKEIYVAPSALGVVYQ